MTRIAFAALLLAGCGVSALGSTTGSGTTTGTAGTTSGGPSSCNCPANAGCLDVDGGSQVCVALEPDGGLCPYWPPQACGAVLECSCADGTNPGAGCAGPPTCDDACCGHGGAALACATFAQSCETSNLCCAGLVCVSQDDIASCLVANGQPCQGPTAGCASGNCAAGTCACQASGKTADDCGSCCAQACSAPSPEGAGGVCS